MKRCPECRRDYYDDSLLYCLDDGNALLAGPVTEDECSTAILPDPLQPKMSVRNRGEITETGTNSIAVLPFTNVSADPENEYFCDGLAEELLNALAKIQGLKVTARTSAFSFKGKNVDMGQIARALRVKTVLEGSVRKSGNRLRITVQLVNAADGFQIWSERYERELSDIFDVQEEITLAIVDSLKLKLLGDRLSNVVRRYTANTEAYSLYLRGRFFWNKRTEEDANRGIECFARSLSLDPEFALAYSGLADCQILLGDVGVQALLPREAFVAGRDSAARALELDGTLAQAHGTMGHVCMHLFDWSKAKREFERALELDPDYAQVLLYYAYYLAFNGRFGESIETIDRALQLDPLSLPVNRSSAELLYFAGRYDESISRFERSIEMEEHSMAHNELARVYEHLGNYEAARAGFARARDLSHDNPETLASLAHCHAVSGSAVETRSLLNKLFEMRRHRYVSSYDLALVHGGLDEKDEAFRWLERAYKINDGWLVYITVDPRWAPLHGDPRFAEIVDRVGLPNRPL